MVRYHVREDGYVGRCTAQPGNCGVRREGGGEDTHYESKQEAVAAAEVRMSEKHNVTASASKTSSSNTKNGAKKPSAGTKSKSVGEFKIPHSKPVEGYMGAQGYIGGNLIRLQEEQGIEGAYSNKVIVKEMREDIKKAIKSGYLPARMEDGTKVSYSIRGSSNGNAINITAKVDESPLDFEPVIKDGYLAHRQVSLASKHEKSLDEIKEKLEDLHTSYNYNRSNSMVDYFDTNFYGGAKVESEGGFELAHKSKKKAIKAVVDEYVDNKQTIDPTKEYSHEEKVAFIDKAMKDNPKVKEAIEQWANASNEYTLANDAENLAYNESTKISQRERQDFKYQGDNDRKELLSRMKTETAHNRTLQKDLIQRNKEASGVESLNFYSSNSDRQRGTDTGVYYKQELVREVFSSMENRGVRKKTRRLSNSRFWR